MQLPPLTDLLALAGIDLVLCAAILRLLARQRNITQLVRWVVMLAVFSMFWLPVGAAQLPALAFVRGISSDLSTTLVALACLSLGRSLFGWPVMAQREGLVLSIALAVAAAVLYPTALGWGNWDAYRPGWGSFDMLGILLMVSLACWTGGLRLLPALIGLALLTWVAGLMESGNLWDYLMDPWLAIWAVIQCMKAGVKNVLHRRRLRAPATQPSPL